MTTTTLRLPSPLKSRVGPRAAAAGRTAPAFLLQAVQENVREAEVRATLARQAQPRFDAPMVDVGGIGRHEMHDDPRHRADGERAARPKARACGR